MFTFFRKTTLTSLLFIFMIHPLLAADSLFRPDIRARDPESEMRALTSKITENASILRGKALSISAPTRYKARGGRGSGVVAEQSPLKLLEEAVQTFAECIEIGQKYLPDGQVELVCNEIASSMKVYNGREPSMSEMFSSASLAIRPGAGACVAADVSRSSGGAAAASGADIDHRPFQKSLTEILENACRSVIEAELNYIKLTLRQLPLAAKHTDKINHFIHFGMAPLPDGHRTSPQLLHDQKLITETCDLVFDCYANLSQALEVAPDDVTIALDVRLKARMQLLEDAVFQAFQA